MEEEEADLALEWWWWRKMMEGLTVSQWVVLGPKKTVPRSPNQA